MLLIIEKETQDIILQLQNKKIIMLWQMEKNLFNQPIKLNIKTYVNIRKITTGQEDDYTTGCLLD